MSWEGSYKICSFRSQGLAIDVLRRNRIPHRQVKRRLRSQVNPVAAAAKSGRQAFEVHLDAAELGVLQKVGTVFRHETKTDLPASFEYDEAWLKSDRVFMLDPRLALWTGEQHPPNRAPAFGIFMDSAPDRWGRVLMERREVARAARENRKPRILQEF